MAKGGTLSIQGVAAGENVEVIVADNGIGISADDLHRITEPLYSTKARGLGLGLAIARAILDKNNASMRVTSELGKGSTFTVRLVAAAP
jgi:two-component system sensor kinase FixL